MRRPDPAIHLQGQQSVHSQKSLSITPPSPMAALGRSEMPSALRQAVSIAIQWLRRAKAEEAS